MAQLIQFIIIMKRQRTVSQNKSQKGAFQEQSQTEVVGSWRKEILLNDVTRLENENASLKLRCKDMEQIEEERQLALKQNAQLLTENDKMSRFLHQLKSQNEILKKKSESLNVKKYEIVEGMEQDKVSLLKKLQNLQDELAQMEVIKSTELSQVKSQYQMSLQTLKRQLSSSQDAHQLQIRKLKDQLNKRQNQLIEYGNKLKNISSSNDYEIYKLKDEKEKLRSELTFKQEDHAKYIENLKTKLENNYLQEVEALKRLHCNNLQEIEMENVHFREALEERSRQMEQNEIKFNKQRVYYEDTIDFIKKDNECYRRKIYQNQKIGHYELGDMKQQLELMHQAQIIQIRSQHQLDIEVMQNQIAKLESISRDKNMQIEQLIKEKVAIRSSFDQEYIRYKDEYAQLNQRYKQVEFKYEQSIRQADNRQNDKQKRISYLQAINSTQKANSQTERRGLEQIISNLKQELFNDRINSKQSEQGLKEQAVNLKNQLNALQKNYEQKQDYYQRQVNELKKQATQNQNMLNQSINDLTSQNKLILKENQSLKNEIIGKQKQIINVGQRLKLSTVREDQFEAQINELRTKLIRKDQISTQTIKQLKNRLQDSSAFALSTLQSNHQLQLRMQANRIHILQVQLQQKDAQLSDLLIRYKKMVEEFKVLAEQQVNKKSTTLKFAGASCETLAAKNIFDVYLKTKVLAVCGDTLRQSNS